MPALHYVWKVMHYIFFTCNAKFVALYMTSIYFETHNTLQCIAITFSNTPSLNKRKSKYETKANCKMQV